MSETLAPCPFCGSTNVDADGCSGEEFDDDEVGHSAFAVWCLDCGAQGPMTREDWSAAWNHRVADRCPDWLSEALNSGDGTYRP